MGLHIPTFLATVACCLIFLFLFISLRLKMGLDCDFPTTSRRKLRVRVKTGDILAVAYGSMRAKLVKVFTGSMWAHSAVIVRSSKYDDIPCVLEVARYSRDERGLMMTPLKEWLEKNEGNTVALASYSGTPIEEDAVVKFLRTHAHVKEEMFVAKWLMAMIKRPYNRTGGRKDPPRKQFCSEMVAYFLQEVGVLRKKYHPSGYKPWELLYGHLPMRKHAKYSSPILIET